MSKSARFWALAAMSLTFAAPLRAADPSAETVVATVNGTEITLGHMIALRETLPSQYLQLGDDVLFSGILDQIIQQVALSEVAEAELSARQKLTLENQRRTYLAGTVLEEVAAASVTDEALQALYAKQYADAAPVKEYNAAHILVDTEAEAKELKARIDAGEEFSEVAKSASTGPSGPNGGDLGWFGLGAMVPPFEEAVIALADGQVSDPVQTEFGWHVIKLIETRMSAAPEFEAVRDELAGALQQTAVEARVTELTEAAEVTRMVEGIDPAILKNIELLGN